MPQNDGFDEEKRQDETSEMDTSSATSREASLRMYRWYVLGCQLNGQQPMERTAFEEQQLIQLLGGDILNSKVFNRTSAEWELAREDALWTTILQRLSRLNVSLDVCDLVAAIRTGRNSDENGEAGDAGVPAYRPPFVPVLVGAGAKLHPDLDPEPWCRDAG